MTDALTNNRSLTLPAVGGDSGTWGNVLNSGTFTQVDLVLGGTQSVSVTSADLTLTQTQWNNLAIASTGTLTGNHTVYLPFSPNSTTAAVGGLFVLNNNNTGSFSLTVSTTASGATGVVVPQGQTSLLYSDQTNVRFADESANRYTPVNGNPNGQLAGTAATAVNPPHPFAFDYSGGTGAWVPTSTGTSTTTVWAQLTGIGAALPVPGGYLSPISSTTNPIPTTDTTATTIYYTPFMSQWAVIHNGTQLIPYQFSQLSLVLSATQAADNIYDVFLAYNGGTPVIGTGPSWSAGTGGSITAGSCARGTGAGGTAYTRLNGVPVNAASVQLTYNTGSGNNTITVAANQAVLLSPIFVDHTAGQVTCHRSYGQNRKWGISNVYNRQPIILKAGDSTSSWNYNTATLRASDNAPSSYASAIANVGSGTSCNAISSFDCLGADQISLEMTQTMQNSAPAGLGALAIGVNSITASSGIVSNAGVGTNMAGLNITVPPAKYISAPVLGVSQFFSLEKGNGSGTQTWFGSETNMILSAAFRG